MTYREVIMKSFVLSNSFGQSNELPGKTILITLKNLSSYISVLMACWRSGLIPAVYSPNLKEGEYENIINEFKFDYVYSDFEFESQILKSLTLKQPITVQNPSVDDYSLNVDGSNIAVLLFSSGTSGKQKCIPLSFVNIVNNIQAFTNRLGITKDNLLLCGSPLWHAHGLYNSFLTGFFINATVVYSGPLNMMNVTNLLRSISQRRDVVFHITPSMIPILMMYSRKNEKSLLPSFYRVICGTSFLDMNSKKEFESCYNQKILQQYGMTETLFMTINNLYSEEKPDSVGQALEGVDIEIWNGSDVLPAGKPGSIRVKSNSCYGSYQLVSDQSEWFRDGFFYTGDIGYFDEQNCLFITGREKDLIKKGGFSIASGTITARMMEFGEIDEAYTIGVKDASVGEEIYSFYIADKDLNESEIKNFLKQEISANLVPKRIFKINSFPKTATGKIARPEMEIIVNQLIK
jgi:long-chain acyl-CoA synthetase